MLTKKYFKATLIFFYNFMMSFSLSAEEKKIQFAAGIGLTVYLMDIYGETTYNQYTPEAVFYSYIPISDRASFWLRPGLRINYSFLQPAMPQAFKIEECDFRYSIEASVLYDWYVVPSFGFGAGLDYRTTTLKVTQPIVVTNDNISGTENIPFWYLQGSIGIPFLQGFVITEPYVRYSNVQNDARYGFGYGVEVTFSLL